MIFFKRYIITSLCILLAVTAVARERSLEEMKRAASAVLPHPARVRAADGQVTASTIEVLQRKQHFTVLGYASGNGFAVVANDDNVRDVLGYSTSAYDSINTPDGFKWWMENVDRALASNPVYEPSSTVKYNKTGVPYVEPMLTTSWGQDQPFNLQCPKKLYGKGNMMTGCIATAMAQIMNYYKWPLVGDGDLVYNFSGHVYADFASTSYDWDNLNDDYKKGGYTEAEANAVSELMLHCGVSVNMKYDDTSSGSQSQFVPEAMREHFRYNKNINYRNRMLHTDEEWMGCVYQELAAGRPILYTGQDNKVSYGHAFVFDGYNSEGYVSVNWGWDGDHDGYYDINILNSGNLGMEFTDLQSMVVGIAMQDDEIEHSIEVGTIQDLTLYTTSNPRMYTLDTSMLLIYCMNDYDLNGTLAMVMPTQSGTRVLATIESFNKEKPLHSFTYINPEYESYNITIPFGLSNGTYFFYLAFKEEGSDVWQPLYSAEGTVGFFKLDKEGTNYNVVGVIGNIPAEIKDVEYSTPNKISTVSYNISGQIVGADYHGIVIQNGNKVMR